MLQETESLHSTKLLSLSLSKHYHTHYHHFSFDLSSTMTVNEAIFALDYIDHDFYVFRDAETKDISVVYKRNAGGVGLIQPQQ